MKGSELLIKVPLIILDIRFRKMKNFFPNIGVVIIITIIIIGCIALGGPWPPQANVASDLEVLGIPQPFSTTQFPCVFLYTVKDISVSLLKRLDLITFGPA